MILNILCSTLHEFFLGAFSVFKKLFLGSICFPCFLSCGFFKKILLSCFCTSLSGLSSAHADASITAGSQWLELWPSGFILMNTRGLCAAMYSQTKPLFPSEEVFFSYCKNLCFLFAVFFLASNGQMAFLFK